MTETEMLKRNVSDLQEQLQKSYTRIKDLNKEVNKLNKVKAISDLADDSNVKYLCEEVIADLEDLKLEVHQL